MKIETLAVHAGQSIDRGTGAVVPSICLSTTFERSQEGDYPRGYRYIREQNPNREALEKCLSQLESGVAAAAFASGSAAMMTVFQALSPGDHAIAPLDLYAGTRTLLQDIFVPWGLQVTFVDLTDPEKVRQAVQKNTKLILIETPSNPLLKITDIAEIADIARQANARCVCDNTWASPIGQSPFLYGADLVIHATTKYLGGHSDLLGGAVISKTLDDFFHRIQHIQISGGAVPSPFDCWLLLRGIKTLPYRLRAHTANALQLAEFLAAHPQVEAVHYPGLKAHPGHEIAARQMQLFGGMLSFQVKGGKPMAFAVASGVKLFARATSLGGVESFIEHRASIEGPGSTTPDNLLRISVGLEHPEDLIADLSQALG